jgi:hypothetical protein
MKKFFERFDAEDIMIFGGLLLVGVGCWFVHPALSFIVVGLGMFTLGTHIIRVE